MAVAGEIDPHPDRQGVRRAWIDDDRVALRRLAEPERVSRLEPAVIVLLADALGQWGPRRDGAAAVTLLRRGRLRYPRDAQLNQWLAHYLEEQGPEGRSEAIQYYSLAYALQPAAGHDLAHLLADRGRGEEAEAIFGELAALSFDAVVRTRNLACFGRLLKERGRVAEAASVVDRAVSAGHEAIRLDAQNAEAHYNLGKALEDQGKPDEAIAEYRLAIRLRPDFAEAYNGLGAALCDRKRDYAGAEAAFRAAIRLRPEDAQAHYNLGNALAGQGKFDEAVAEYRRAAEIAPRNSPVARAMPERIRRLEQRIALSRRLTGVLKRQDVPKNAAEGLVFARMCYDRALHANAVRLWAGALVADPKLGADRQAQYRYSAACAAALAGCGRGKDNPPPDEAAKARLRQQALDWLKAELVAWSSVWEEGPDQAGLGHLKAKTHSA
jgi:tetratricopeptide (TPR) repeat protein